MLQLRPIWTSVGCLVLGFALGAMIPRDSNPPVGASSKAAPTASARQRIGMSGSLPRITPERIHAQRSDLEEALNQIFMLPDHQDRTFALFGLLNDRTLADYPTILAVFKQRAALDTSRGRDQWIMAQALQIMASKDPATVLAFASSIPQRQQRLAFQEAALRGWSKQDLGAARQWYDQITDPATKDRLAVSMAQSIAHQSFEEALSFIDEHLKPNRARDARSQILRELAQTQPQEAARQLEALQLGQSFNHLYHTIASELAADNLEEALSWMGQLNKKEQRTMAIQGIMQQMPLEDTNTIEQVIGSLTGQQDRLNATLN